jgi:gibberellin 20-oxidase
MAIDCIKTMPSKTTHHHHPKDQDQCKDDNKSLVFDAQVLRYQSSIPQQFIWPDHEKPSANAPELQVPLIDLGDFLSGNPDAAMEASRLVGEACQKHGFFLVVNHGVDKTLIAHALNYMDNFFELPLSEKQKAQRKIGESCGYASSFTGRFSSKLPWKETLSFSYTAEKNSSKHIEQYFHDRMGEDFAKFGYVAKAFSIQFGSVQCCLLVFTFLKTKIHLPCVVIRRVYQDYCEAMSTLSLGIMELLGMSLGVSRAHFREYFEENDSIMRLNYYPPCQKPELTLGTGPHCDPTSLTILHQDQVGGLQVYVDNEWCSISPNFDAFVVNIGDTFMVRY